MSGHAGDVGMDVQRPEARPEAHLFGRRQTLVAEEDHLVLDKRGAVRGDGLVGELLGQIDAGDLGAERARQAADLERSHGILLGAAASIKRVGDGGCNSLNAPLAKHNGRPDRAPPQPYVQHPGG